MACACRAHKKTDGSNNISRAAVIPNLPHSTKPGESCIFCAEKHISTACSIMNSHGVRAITRQLMLGELECARRHTFVEYTDLCKLICETMAALSLRESVKTIIDKMAPTRELVYDLALKTDNGEDVTTGKLYQPSTGYVTNINPLIGEIYFAAGWRLAHECGYMHANRNTIIGDLSMAQVHLYKYKYEFAERIRDIRHKVQRSESQFITGEWNVLAQNMDAVITPAINDIKETYGDDLSGYLTV